MLIILVGRAGVGKTAVRNPLAERLHARGIGPDDHPHRWDWAIRRMDSAPRVVLECCAVPRAVRARMDSDTVVVELFATEEVRRQRLFKQGHDAEEVERRMRESSVPIGWEDALVPDLRIEVTDLDPQDAAERITEHFPAFLPA